MEYKTLMPIGNGIYQVDLLYDGIPEMSSAYIIKGEQNVIIDTGASNSLPQLLDALKQLEIERDSVDWVIITHIHLDHSGGAGQLLNFLPNAKIIVHPRGARHLIDPAKLIASAREVYGESFERIYSPILPVPAEKIITAPDGMELYLGDQRVLTFWDSPGHAWHHFAVHDSITKGIFCGDTVGMHIPSLTRLGVKYILPFTTPTQYDPEIMLQTLTRLANLKPERLYFTHFGYQDNAQSILEYMKKIIPQYTEYARNAYHQEPTLQSIIDALREYHVQEMYKLRVPEDHSIFNILETEIDLNAQGLLLYFQSSVRV